MSVRERVAGGVKILGMGRVVRQLDSSERYEAGSFHLILTRFQPGDLRGLLMFEPFQRFSDSLSIR